MTGKLVFQLPDFKHEFGYGDHHNSLMRTVEVDEEGDYIPWSGDCPPKWRWEVHGLLDYYVFYPISQWLSDKLGDGDSMYSIARAVLGFFWGFNCCFPRKDVVLYTAWYLRGCPAVRVWKKTENGYEVT